MACVLVAQLAEHSSAWKVVVGLIPSLDAVPGMVGLYPCSDGGQRSTYILFVDRATYASRCAAELSPYAP